MMRDRAKLTSHEAWISASEFVNDHHRRIMEALRRSGEPMAAQQIADEIAMNHVAVNRRMSELLDDNAVVETDTYHINRSGRRAVKYALPGWKKKRRLHS